MLQGMTFSPMATRPLTSHQASPNGMLAASFKAFDTTCRFLARTQDETLFKRIHARCDEYNQVLSHTLATSSLSFLNGCCGMPARVNPELAHLIEVSLGYCARTGGLFDFTAGTLERLWNFHRAEVPTPDEVEDALAHVDFRRVSVHGDVVCVSDSEARVVLGSIAKGYIADGLRDLMRETGVESGLVDLGGNLAAVGTMPNGSPWRFQIVDPANRTRPKAVIECADESVVTSGTYERFFVQGGHSYHHIIDPRTGYPARSDVASVSVLAADSLTADAYSTALLIMGSERCLDFAEHTPGIEVFVIRNDGAVLMSSGMGRRVVYRS